MKYRTIDIDYVIETGNLAYAKCKVAEGEYKTVTDPDTGKDKIEFVPEKNIIDGGIMFDYYPITQEQLIRASKEYLYLHLDGTEPVDQWKK